MKIKKDWFGMFSSTREYARSIYVREPTEEVEKRIWTKRIKTAAAIRIMRTRRNVKSCRSLKTKMRVSLCMEIPP
mgnify:CR=1 FL=1